MNRPSIFAACAIVAALSAPAAAAGRTTAEACALKAQGVYGFQCHGSTSTGGAAEPVTFIGTVEGRYDGFYEGHGTLNSSLGSVPTHVAGYATFGANCMGRVAYTTNEILLPDGGVVPLPPLVVDFVPVNNFSEILGTPVAAPGVSGDAVPRMACRLVRIEK
ncbi:MAG: hypothetical protein IT517_18360 [Burkholderiales bacterium]|nr:hypothetical protein [Burkholderiales bacterium]